MHGRQEWKTVMVQQRRQLQRRQQQPWLAMCSISSGSFSFHGGSAVVGHRWQIAAGLDERALAWQVVGSRLCALQARCTARRCALGRPALRWRCVRRVKTT